ncbi:hypothetical protein BGZ63DRAFT_377579 [Mariannaea sp. PMI_226]|nr:hypothetical protein BGZ63DRAFT_377579 [Mariannaea sp. PMI_226]
MRFHLRVTSQNIMPPHTQFQVPQLGRKTKSAARIHRNKTGGKLTHDSFIYSVNSLSSTKEKKKGTW